MRGFDDLVIERPRKPGKANRVNAVEAMDRRVEFASRIVAISWSCPSLTLIS